MFDAALDGATLRQVHVILIALPKLGCIAFDSGFLYSDSLYSGFLFSRFLIRRLRLQRSAGFAVQLPLVAESNCKKASCSNYCSSFSNIGMHAFIWRNEEDQRTPCRMTA